MECPICYDVKHDMFTCHRCSNQHCTDCKRHIHKCPFCRVGILTWDEIEEINTFTDQYFQIVNTIVSNMDYSLHEELFMEQCYDNMEFLMMTLESQQIYIRKPYFKEVKELIVQDLNTFLLPMLRVDFVDYEEWMEEIGLL